jgi:hypothetical protein
MRLLALIALIIGVGLFEAWVELAAQNHPARVFIAGAVVFGLVGAVLFLFPSGALIVVSVALAGGWAFALVAALDAREKELGWYCKYGAQSQAEIDDCLSSVNTDDIAELDTPAARFARGETFECGHGSGRYCRDAAEDLEVEYGG